MLESFSIARGRIGALLAGLVVGGAAVLLLGAPVLWAMVALALAALLVGGFVTFQEPISRVPEQHPDDPLERARHRGWMEFGSSILADLWGLETATDAVGYERARARIADKFARVEDVLGNGPYFAGNAFSLVDAVFAPIFRYFDLFDTLADTAVFAALPRVQAWRQALSVCPSVRAAVEPDYPDRLRDFLVRHDAFLLKQAA